MNDLPESTEMTIGQARKLHVEAVQRDDILIWTIFDSPYDHPGKFVVRPYSIRQNAPLTHHMVSDSLEGLRANLPGGLIWMNRCPDDDARIVETWL